MENSTRNGFRIKAGTDANIYLRHEEKGKEKGFDILQRNCISRPRKKTGESRYDKTLCFHVMTESSSGDV